MTSVPTAADAIAPTSHGSRTRSRRPERDAPRLSFGPPPPLRAFLPAPGMRLISIIARYPSGDLSHGQPDGKHQEGCDFIRDQAVHRAITNGEIGERVRLLDGQP